MALPVAKLGTLALRTLSKPIASRLKSQAAVHPKFRNFIIAIAQIHHRMTTKIQRRIYGHTTDMEIRPLDEQKAVQAATDLIGEAFIFSVAVAALIFEVQRSARSEARKEEARKQELEKIYKGKTHRLCLDVGIGAQTMELESDFLNTDVWMYMELRLGIEDPIPWY